MSRVFLELEVQKSIYWVDQVIKTKKTFYRVDEWLGSWFLWVHDSPLYNPWIFSGERKDGWGQEFENN